MREVRLGDDPEPFDAEPAPSAENDEATPPPKADHEAPPAPAPAPPPPAASTEPQVTMPGQLEGSVQDVPSSWTPLHLAARVAKDEGGVDVIKMMVQQGADCNTAVRRPLLSRAAVPPSPPQVAHVASRA